MKIKRFDWRRAGTATLAVLLTGGTAYGVSTWQQEIEYGPCLHGEVWWTVVGPDGVVYLDGGVPVDRLPRCAGGER